MLSSLCVCSAVFDSFLTSLISFQSGGFLECWAHPSLNTKVHSTVKQLCVWGCKISGTVFLCFCPNLHVHAQIMPNSLRPQGLQPPKFLNPWDSPGVAISFSPWRDREKERIFQTGDWTCVSCVSYTAGGGFTTEPPGKPLL